MNSETKKEAALRKETFNCLMNGADALPSFTFETPEEATGAITALMRGFWKYVDVCIEKELPLHKQTCREGCSYCCSQPIFMDVFEAVATIHGMGSEAATACNEQYDAWYANFSPMQPQLWKSLQENKWDELGKLTRSLTAPCPFLHNDVCTCYASRPMVCRTWLSNKFRFWCAMNPSSVKYTLACQDAIHDAYNAVLLHIANAFEIPLAAGGWSVLPQAYHSCGGDSVELLKVAIAKHLTYSR
ncbi:MAG: YkgJ family cysteine cluster protein [Desulfovibrionales bacterium]|nr:YkgJ family cysteine cluster protein [Desulfovibrionales bacterium]